MTTTTPNTNPLSSYLFSARLSFDPSSELVFDVVFFVDVGTSRSPRSLRGGGGAIVCDDETPRQKLFSLLSTKRFIQTTTRCATRFSSSSSISLERRRDGHPKRREAKGRCCRAGGGRDDTSCARSKRHTTRCWLLLARFWRQNCMVFSTPHEKKKREILKKNQATGKVCLTFRGHYSYIVDLGERGTVWTKKI